MPNYAPDLTGYRVFVAGIVRNVEKTISRDVEKMNEAIAGFGEIYWFLVESDSEDRSIQALESLSKEVPNFSYTSLGSIQNPEQSRTIGMATARNRYLEELRNNPKLSEVDFVVISDFNALNTQITQTNLESCFLRDDWDACFANQTGKYYDIWALRHPLWSPNDCWQQLAFYRQYMKFPEKALFASVQSRMISIPVSSPWIEVDSAFGGLGIYRKSVIEKGEYIGLTGTSLPICEHVPLHLNMRANGAKLFINPSMINTDSTNHSDASSLRYAIVRILKYPYKYVLSKLN